MLGIGRFTRSFWTLFSRCISDDKAINRRIKLYKDLTDDKASKLIEGIYAMLGILDNKASALMRYNGIILAVMTLSVTGRGAKIEGLVGIAIVALTLISIIACLAVVGVFWRFLEIAVPTGSTKVPAANAIEAELTELRKVLRLRESVYQLAWWLALVVSLLLVVYFFRL